MPDLDFEYRISPKAPQVVQVRRKTTDGHNPVNWGLYMHCDSPDEAERILALLQSNQTEGMVRP